MLHIHRAERADALVAALRDQLAVPLADPFAAELVSVPTRGMERWLTQRLSGSLGATAGRIDGVCANVDFPPPRRLLGDAVAVASGIEPDADPWLPERAVWPLLEIAEACRGEAWLAPIAEHLSGARRFGALRHLAALYDRYGLHRPELVREWAAPQLALSADWQAELWRRLRARLGVPSLAERLGPACARLRAQPGLVDLPRRLAIFGLTRLPAGDLEVLQALAAGRDVHLFLLHPSPALWERLRGSSAVRRADDQTAIRPENRLLASWGRDAREMQLVLAGAGDDHHHPIAARQDTLLARLQAAVREDRPPAPGPADPSVQIHACHGRARQVEVVRDAILHALAEDPTLEPRDVIVMCPDIEAFAPLIQATFGEGEHGDLRVRLADRALRQTNPVLAVVAELIELAGQRVTASQVLDLADREPVRRRFRLDDDDLARAQDWIAGAGIRWGLDAAHRAPFKLESLDAGTWRFGLDRLLLGVTMTEDDRRLFGNVLPLDDVESGAIDLAGRLAELIDRLQTALDSLERPQPIAAWALALGAAADALTATAPLDAWQRAELARLLDDAVNESAGATTPLALGELRALLGERLEGRPTRANFRTGHLTICTLVPMRSVPHRVVCLLGLDDGAFPRKAPRDGDDLMLDEPHVGDRDPRSEDRQMLLDALLAATDRLVVTYTGNDERTNAPRPPAVPVGELLDAIGSQDVVVRHPLQPFDPRNFDAARPWGFDSVTLGGAKALTAPRQERPRFLDGPLPAVRREVVELDDLVRFVSHPVRAFLRQRLDVRVGDYDDEIADDLKVELNALEKWGVGDRLLQARLEGVDRRAAILAEIARGELPPGVLGKPVIDAVEPAVDQIVTEAEARVEGPAESLDVRVALPDGRMLNGTVAGVHGDVLRAATYSRLGARHRITGWVRLLALSAGRPDRAFTAATIGRGGVAYVRRVEDPLAVLAALVDLHDRGLREPLPLFCKTSAAYAGNRADPVTAARKAWLSEWSFPREDAEREHVIAFGGVRLLEDVLALAPGPDEQWEPLEESRLGQLARRLWDPLLAVEELIAT